MLMFIGKLMVDIPFVPTHRHMKGGLYQVLSTKVLYSTGPAPMVLYVDEKAQMWVRLAQEFYSPGRFVPVYPDGTAYTEFDDVTSEYPRPERAGVPADHGASEEVHEDPDAGC